MLRIRWTISLFKTGYKKTLETEDLFEPLKDDRSKLLGDRLEKWVSKFSTRKREEEEGKKKTFARSCPFTSPFYESDRNYSTSVYLQTMEHRAGKLEKKETQSESVENYFPHIHMGVHYAGNNTASQRVCDKVLAIVHILINLVYFISFT